MFSQWRYLKVLVFLLGFVPLSGFGAAFTAGNLAVLQAAASANNTTASMIE